MDEGERQKGREGSENEVAQGESDEMNFSSASSQSGRANDYVVMHAP